ncbi:hypothetical protein CTAM01_00509 [Colletotrichum tamarilloi]|uniref:DUF7136 domain-containing protein n=1 Tax=Colletotrichum tamarilloi TaxID=1209934 RepID=A0ABQ9RUS1_9PEZI|nr:uncharacterized protein CTAM01_00509 [Colletotrichum tamarilloi]KAI3544082.1 hypothetical protein CSPX01_05837 [Colletotrichum filicis]KAK1513113.1 hypothetical protein CTAM01_00509 [Colletotrichum tamarilloi]
MHVSLSRSLQLLTFLTGFSSAATITTTPTTSVEVDLIFPRNGSTYKPVWPFPFVFAVQNASKLWPESDEKNFYNFWVKWDLTGYTDINDADTGQLFSSGVWQTEAKNKTADTYTIIDASRRDLVNATQREFRLRYTATMFSACPKNVTGEGPSSKVYDVSYNGTAFFTTDPNGQIPSLVDTTSCPDFVGSFQITGNSHDYGDICPVVSDKEPTSEACEIKMDAALETQVKAAMLTRANCQNGTWPDPEGKLSALSCNAVKTSDAGAKLLGGLVTKSSALVLILAASWAIV